MAKQWKVQPFIISKKLRYLWKHDTKEQAKAWLDDWVKQAKEARLQILVSFAKTLRKHEVGILNYYDEKMTSGKVEGVNNGLKTLVKTAYGYRDWEFFELKIKASHQGRS